MSLSLSSFYTPDYRFLLDGLQVMNQTTPGTFSTSTTATLRSTGENYPDYLVQSGSYVPISVGLSGRVLDAKSVLGRYRQTRFGARLPARTRTRRLGIHDSEQQRRAQFQCVRACHGGPGTGVLRDVACRPWTYRVCCAAPEAKQVAGWSPTASGEARAFLYSAGVMTDLGSLGGGGKANGIRPIGAS